MPYYGSLVGRDFEMSGIPHLAHARVVEACHRSATYYADAVR